MCNEKERAECKYKFEDNLEWACESCEKQRAGDLHPYTLKLFKLRMLREAGYPFRANDITYDEWIDLGRLEQCLKTPAPLESK